MPVARAASRRSTAPPGGVVTPSEPTCSATAPSSADVSSSSVHCQSAVPSTRKSYAADPSACSATIASDDGSGAATAYERSTPLPARCARNRRPSTSSESRASIRAGTPSRARPTATFAGLPPGAARKTPSSPAGTRSVMTSPATATTGSTRPNLPPLRSSVMPDQTPRPESRTRARAVLDALLPEVRARAVDALGRSRARAWRLASSSTTWTCSCRWTGCT